MERNFYDFLSNNKQLFILQLYFFYLVTHLKQYYISQGGSGVSKIGDEFF